MISHNLTPGIIDVYAPFSTGLLNKSIAAKHADAEETDQRNGRMTQSLSLIIPSTSFIARSRPRIKYEGV